MNAVRPVSRLHFVPGHGGVVDLSQLPLRRRMKMLARMHRTGGASVRSIGMRLARWTRNERGEWVEVLGYDRLSYWKADTWRSRYPFQMTPRDRRGSLKRGTRWPSLVGLLP